MSSFLCRCTLKRMSGIVCLPASSSTVQTTLWHSLRLYITSWSQVSSLSYTKFHICKSLFWMGFLLNLYAWCLKWRHCGLVIPMYPHSYLPSRVCFKLDPAGLGHWPLVLWAQTSRYNKLIDNYSSVIVHFCILTF